MLRNLFKSSTQTDYVKVYSHPRSGTHFLEAFLARNFYRDVDLSVKPIIWGHWSNRVSNESGNPFGQLYGSHLFPRKKFAKGPIIYIYRDGRAVANSLWGTENFLNKNDSGISFSDFLLKKLDWEGTPSNKAEPGITIAEHWLRHVEAWHDFLADKPNSLIVSYEDMLENPHKIYEQIHQKFFAEQPALSVSEIDTIRDKQGIKPNSANSYKWRETFTDDDLQLFREQINNNHSFLSDRKTTS